MDLQLQPCRECGEPKVLKPGDYCVACAISWDQARDEYFVVNPDSASDIAEISGLAVSYLQAKQERAFLKNCKYVIFYARNQWQEITVSENFYLPKVMEKIFERLHD